MGSTRAQPLELAPEWVQKRAPRGSPTALRAETTQVTFGRLCRVDRHVASQVPRRRRWCADRLPHHKLVAYGVAVELHAHLRRGTGQGCGRGCVWDQGKGEG